MNVLVLYDSEFGNTERLARAIGAALAAGSTVDVIRASQASPEMLIEAEMLIVGAPTQGFRPTKPVTGLLEQLPPNALAGKKVAAFDTRIDTKAMSSPILGFMVDKGGYAAKHIARGLEKAGGSLIVAPEGFTVEDTQGPLKDGELERAAAWARTLLPG